MKLDGVAVVSMLARMEFLARLWRTAKIWPDPGMGLRPGSGNAVFVTFLILLFIVIGSALVALGFDLDDVDRWLDRQTWIGVTGVLLFRALLAFILLICAVIVLAWAFDRKNEDRPGWGAALGALIVGWFVSATLFAPL